MTREQLEEEIMILKVKLQKHLDLSAMDLLPRAHAEAMFATLDALLAQFRIMTILDARAVAEMQYGVRYGR